MIRFELCSRCCATFLKWSDSGGILKYVRYFLGESKSSPECLVAILSHLLVVCFIFIDSFLLVHLWMSCCGGVRGIMLVPTTTYLYISNRLEKTRGLRLLFKVIQTKPRNSMVWVQNCHVQDFDLIYPQNLPRFTDILSRDFACACWTSTLVQQHYPKKWRPVLLLCCCPQIKPNPWLSTFEGSCFSKHSWWEANLGTRARRFTKKPPEKYSGKE